MTLTAYNLPKCDTRERTYISKYHLNEKTIKHIGQNTLMQKPQIATLVIS